MKSKKVVNDLVKSGLPQGYPAFLADLKIRISSARVKAVRSVPPVTGSCGNAGERRPSAMQVLSAYRRSNQPVGEASDSETARGVPHSTVNMKASVPWSNV